MFSHKFLGETENIYRAIHLADEKLGKRPIERNQLSDIVEKSSTQRLSLEELASVGRASSHIDFLEDKLAQRFRSNEGEVRYIAPTFQTNDCIDICPECNWNRDSGTSRIFYTPEEFGKQLLELKKMGFGVIEISNGTVPRLLNWRSMQQYMEKVKEHIDTPKGEGFGICSARFDDEAMSNLFPNIAQFWVQWMETYDTASYFNVHRFTPRIAQQHQKFSKANFTSRLDSYDDVMALGGDVMLGVQYGVNANEPLFDALMTIEHARYLEQEYGRAPLAFGTVKNNKCGTKESSYSQTLGYNFTLEEYRTFLATYKLAMPSMGRWLNTRVPFSLIEKAVLDNDMYTGECSNMVPGKREGLTVLTNEQAGQFLVFEMAKDQWELGLKRLGLSVNYAWMGQKKEGGNNAILQTAGV